MPDLLHILNIILLFTLHGISLIVQFDKQVFKFKISTCNFRYPHVFYYAKRAEIMAVNNINDYRKPRRTFKSLFVFVNVAETLGCTQADN